MNEENKYKKPWWMYIIVIAVVLSTTYEVGFLATIIFTIIWFFCANKCVEFSNRINKSNNWAFFIGFVFGLIGLLGYWIYYKINYKEVNQNGNE